MDTEQLEYVGFWPRVGAALIDTLLLGIVSGLIVGILGLGTSNFNYDHFLADPLNASWQWSYSDDSLLSWLLPAALVIVLWYKRQATPGKDAIHAKIVDAKTGLAPTMFQLVIRYLGYYVSIFPMCLGLIWVGFDSRKQGWHDKIAGTVVVRPKKRGSDVKFEQAPAAQE